MPLTRDSLIVRITQVGDARSWEEFFSIYHPYLHRVVRRWGINDHDACEIVQDVFVTLLRVLPQFEYRAQRGRFRGWLKTIVQNAAIDRFRRRRRVREVAIGTELAAGAERPPRDDAPWESADRLHLLHRAMRHVRARSKPATWRCFEEHLLNERTAADVSNELGLNPGAVYVNASRTLARVRRKCAELEASGLSTPNRRSADGIERVAFTRVGT